MNPYLCVVRQFGIRALTVTLSISLFACGGGGGGGGSGPSSSNPSSPTVPSVTLQVVPAKVSVGQTATITWSSTNASTCQASGNWSGALSPSGSRSVTPSAGGQYAYQVTCSGAGGSVVQSAALIVPLPVAGSSAENKSLAGETLLSQAIPNQFGEALAVGFADFFQDGRYAMVTHTIEYSPSNQNTANQFGHIRFYQSDGKGGWVNRTTTLLTNDIGCLHPRKVVVADFNQDGLPDVFFACHGFDATPYSGESPHILMSSKNAPYQNIVLPITCFCHSASAADMNGDGFPDILVTDTSVAKRPFFLMNNKNGGFNSVLTKLPNATNNQQIYTAELIDFNQDGLMDVFLGGHEQSGTWPASIYINPGAGDFSAQAAITLPALNGFGFPLDIAYKAGQIYLARTVDAGSGFYGSMGIQRINFSTMQSQLLYQHAGAYQDGSTWFPWIVLAQNKIYSMNALYGVVVNQ